jgi:hypothetical protein
MISNNGGKVIWSLGNCDEQVDFGNLKGLVLNSQKMYFFGKIIFLQMRKWRWNFKGLDIFELHSTLNFISWAPKGYKGGNDSLKPS